MKLLFSLLFYLTFFVTSDAFTVAPYFNDHAVFQAGESLNIFGTSSSGDVITVALNGNKYTGTTESNGNWNVIVTPQIPSMTGQSLVISSTSGSTVTLNDILFGDVYVIAGEGNVLMTVSSIYNSSNIIAEANNYATMLRLFQTSIPAPDQMTVPVSSHRHGHKSTVPSISSSFEKKDTPAIPWTPSSSSFVGAGNWTTYSAVGYLFGKYLVDNLKSINPNIPIGIIVAAVGGSPLQAWVGPSTFAQCNNAPAAPRFSNSSIFNNVIEPLAQGPLNMKGLVFWQGETNTAMAVPDTNTDWYACALPSYLDELRATFGNPNLFITLVQLPPVAAQFWTDAVPEVRKTQQGMMYHGNTIVVSAVDTGVIGADFSYLHSPLKDVVARRLVNATLANIYNSTTAAYLPAANPQATFTSANSQNITTITVSFDPSSLNAPLYLDPNINCPNGFPEGDPNNLWISYVCGAWRVRTDQRTGQEKWYNALEATISADGTQVIVTVQFPGPNMIASLLQYSWAPWTAAALHDANTVPIFPFMVPVTGYPVPPTLIEEVHGKKVSSLKRDRRAQAWLDLVPPVWTPLPVGTVSPQGWLAQQLQVEVEGMVGSLVNFYPPIAQSPWINVTCPWPNGCQDTDEGEDFAYWFQAAVPLALLTDPSCSGSFCKQVEGFVKHILDSADPTTGWLGPPSSDTDGNANFAVWVGLTGLFQYYEGTKDPRILPAIYKHLHESFRRLTEGGPLVAWAQSRYQDYVWLIQSIMDADPMDNNGEKTFLTSFIWVIAGQQNVVYEEWFLPAFFPLGNTGWNFSTHGVNMAEGLKSGAVLYRMTGSPFAVQSSYDRLRLIDYYHGGPHGALLADETLAESHPSHATELCAVVESIFSLNVMHEILGDASFAERAEKIAYNALPGTWSSDMWAHQYLQQPNAINAIHTDNHIWLADGPDATTFGLAPNYPCCTANGPQGWPRFVPRTVHLSSDNGIALSLLAPVIGNIPLPNNGGTVGLNVSTNYPFDDYLDITLTNAPSNMPFYFRVPSWATSATLSINGGTATPIGTSNGTMYRVTVSSTPYTLHIELNPEIYVDSVGLLYNGAIAIHRGALLYGMHLEEVYNITQSVNTSNPNHPVVVDYSVNSSSVWNVALVYDPSDPAGPSKFFTFQRTNSYNTSYPFDHITPPLQITVQVREIPSWTAKQNSADIPPVSPVCTSSGTCGNVFSATFYPYGMTHIRMSVLPWTTQSSDE